jgi:hypothetical protein
MGSTTYIQTVDHHYYQYHQSEEPPIPDSVSAAGDMVTWYHRRPRG